MDYIEDLKGIGEKELEDFIEKNLEGMPTAKRLLVLFPDYTRIDFSHIIAPLISQRFKESSIDFLNAGGNHSDMTDK